MIKNMNKKQQKIYKPDYFISGLKQNAVYMLYI